jgi:predicted lipoprotein with Yx(FWY)xxD motif
MRRMIAALALAAAVALVVAGTGSAASRATVKTRHGKLGTFLVAGNGRTLYLFEKDKTSKSTCSGQCAQFWPPLLTSGKPKAAGKARASLFGTTRRSDGKLQVTYKGHPLYTFSQDTKPGDTNGEGYNAFGAKWYVLAPSGKKIDND